MLKSSLHHTSTITAFIIGLPIIIVGWLGFSLLFSPLHTGQEKENEPIRLANGITAQSFRAEYLNLSKIYVKYSSVGAGVELEVSLHRGSLDGSLIAHWTGLYPQAANSLQLYAFPPQADSKNQLYFLEFEAKSATLINLAGVTLAQAPPETYPSGQLYLNGEPTQAALFYLVEYEPNPGELLRSFFEKQAQFEGLPWLALLCLGLTFGVAGILLWLLARYRLKLGFLLGKSGLRPWLIFGGLLLSLRLLLSLSFMLITPPLQGPDEPGHIGKALGLAEGKPDASFTAPMADLMQRTRFIAHFAWLTYADNPIELYPANVENRQPDLYYTLAAGLVKVGSLFGTNFTSQIYLTRLTSVLLGLMTVAAGLGLGYLWRHESTGLALALPLSVALLPEAIHLSAVANNDNGAIAFGAIVAWGMGLLFLRGLRPLFFGIALVGLVLSIYSKASANALLPGFGLGFYMLAWLHWQNRRVRLGLLLLPVAGLLLGMITLFFLTDHNRAASAWYFNPTLEIALHAERTPQAESHSGQFVLKLSSEGKPVEQQINLFNTPSFQRVRVTGWLKTATQAGDTAALVRVQTAKQTLIEERIIASPEWRLFSFEINANADEINHTRLQTYLQLQLACSGAGTIYLDDLSLSPTDSLDTNLLANPSFEETLWTWRDDWQEPNRSVRSFKADMLDAIQNGSGLNYGTIFLQNFLFLFITFWGAFGWSQVLYAGAVYLLGGAIFLLALFGLLRRSTWQGGSRAFHFFCLCSALTTTLALQFIRLPTSWMYIGTPDIIHSRHAFAALLPQLVILLVGLRGLHHFKVLPRRIGQKNRESAIIKEVEGLSTTLQVEKLEENHTGGWLWLTIWAWGSLLFILTILALLATIFPFYYNR